jgi:hypothetical protein
MRRPTMFGKITPPIRPLLSSCLGALFFGACATTSQTTPALGTGRDAPGDRSSLASCAATNVPEAVLAVGMAATVASPLAPLAAAGYYGAVLYRCHGASGVDVARQSEAEALRRETTALIEHSREEILKTQAIRVDALAERIAASEAAAATRRGDARRAVDDVVSETEARIRRTADEAIRDVYRQMDEIRRVKIQVVDDEP